MTGIDETIEVAAQHLKLIVTARAATAASDTARHQRRVRRIEAE